MMSDLLSGRAFSAVLTPFHQDGTVDHSAVPGYAAYLEAGGVEGLAVGVHTGRGAHLPLSERVRLVRSFREASTLPIIAGLHSGRQPADVRERTVIDEARALTDAGCDAFLVTPPLNAGADDTVRYHERLRGGVPSPLIAFALYESASGNEYDAGLVARLVNVGVDAVKLALLRDAITSYDIASVLTASPRRTLLLSGEDRMLPASLLWGCDGLLVGMAAAMPAFTMRLTRAHRDGEFDAFAAASGDIDRLAALVFREPMDGYIARLFWLARRDGALPSESAWDPWASAETLLEEQRFLAEWDESGLR